LLLEYFVAIAQMNLWKLKLHMLLTKYLYELLLEAVLPFAFSYGTGSPKTKCTRAISLKTCIQRYFRLAMPQFMTADVVSVLYQLFSQQLSYETGIMTCWNQNPREDFGQMLSRLTSKDFEIPSTNPECP
jgi:hypothetical protein